MLRKIVSILAVMLLLASYTANAISMDCGDMSPADCKKEFMTKMDKEVMMKTVAVVKNQMEKGMEMFSEMKDEFPADSMHAKMLMDGVDEIKKQIPLLEKMSDMDTEGIENTLGTVIMSKKLNIEKAQKEESDLAEKFEESLKKHNQIMKGKLEEDAITFLKDVEQMWTDMYSGLRPEDMKEYPQYMEINDVMKTLMDAESNKEKMFMLVKLLKMMNDFMETPFIKAAMNSVCDNC